MNYTKGEWQIADGTFVYCLNSGGENRFDCGIQAGRDEHGKRTSIEELEANAHLISAAPDMYEALKEWLALLDKQREEYNTSLALIPGSIVKEGPIARKARRALSKAEGATVATKEAE